MSNCILCGEENIGSDHHLRYPTACQQHREILLKAAEARAEKAEQQLAEAQAIIAKWMPDETE